MGEAEIGAAGEEVVVVAEVVEETEVSPPEVVEVSHPVVEGVTEVVAGGVVVAEAVVEAEEASRVATR